MGLLERRDFLLGATFLLSLAGLPACARAGGAQVTPPAAPQASDSAPTPAARLELDEDERRLSAALRRHTDTFRRHGARDGDHPWELLESVEYITSTLESEGIPIERATTELDGVVFHSFSVSVMGRDRATPPWLVLASYDSLWPRLVTGQGEAKKDAEGGALEAAGWLELVHMLGKANLERGVRFVLVGRAEVSSGLPVEFGELTGTSGVLYLGPLGGGQLTLYGSTSEIPLGQGLGEELRSSLPDAGPLRAQLLQRGQVSAGTSETELPNVPQLFLGSLGAGEDFDLAAVRLVAVRRAVGTFLGEGPSNDEMVTPLYAGVR
ncbi:MAG: hypothetical protein B6A08_17785 [Sorangiineae bacterium NIC37A_2]|jgi:hypothetical protein|nr:MAG: hypothetical protein B6A08_17785 [Sorangiineae bacterium NIC37A_2]